MEKTRVVIVDDSRDAANLMAHVIELNDMTAQVCDTTEQAIAFKPNAALIDLNLRNSAMDGFEFASIIRQACGDKVMLIAFTGLIDVDASQLLAAGFNNILYKPVNVEQVIDMIVKETPMPIH